jgi:hypothetical protein
MPLKGALSAFQIRHWKCPCRRHFQHFIQGTGNAPEGGIYNFTSRVLEITLNEIFTAAQTWHRICP